MKINYFSTCSNSFRFDIRPTGGHFEIYCLGHPSLNGRDSDPRKTHLFRSGQLCFHSGREPRTMDRALALAKQWAEYWEEYRRTGVVQD